MKIVDKLKSYLIGSVFRSMSFVLTANIISQLESFIFVIIATKTLSVEDYGIYTIVMTLIYTVIELSDMGMNGAVIRFSSQYYSQNEYDKELEIVNMALKKKFRNSLIVILAIIIFSKYISIYFFSSTKYNLYFIISAFGIGFSLVNSLNNSILQGRRWYKKYFYSIVLSNLILLILILMLYFTNTLSVINIVAVNVACLLISMIISYRLANISIVNVFRYKPFHLDVVKNFNSFGMWMLMWSIMSIMQSKVDVFMLSTYASKEQVSYYDLAMKMTKPILMICSSYAQVLNPILATLTSKQHLKNNINKITKFVVFVTGIILISIVFAKPAIYLIFGNKYANSILPLDIILVSIIFFVWTIPFNGALYAMNKPYIFCIAAAVGLVTTITFNVLLLPRYGAIGASMTFLLAQIIGLVVSIIGYRINIKKEG
ncbi:polysaccharide biosynthesis protein [Clostridium folliculivorans]|uniref:Polysaccharide biosynthesis protein n=1 Tax=Clostridium folliculivorans TaxID=2886038 RepID=A0A9W6DCR1_9CLOT|nr:oligosaccharide flippase family protein [Clostridium folliculivorans]GKU27271.1 polysaccharide biosynthesis protein [Clostridium folliculivorans]